ncbi:unnamed protein product, partial [Mesorhabditis belari]|uniref:Uncharacterized protein n=1 Tax=Mesorhabditis belari TaxID=2138241 RepID=A0AAF3F7J3_9BILA
MDESTLNDFFNEPANLSTIESLLFATSRPLDDLEPPTASDTPTSSVQQPIEHLEEDLRGKEMENLHAELRKMIQELMVSREENRKLRGELNQVNRLYLKKSIEVDLAREEISRLKGESIDDENVTYLD